MLSQVLTLLTFIIQHHGALGTQPHTNTYNWQTADSTFDVQYVHQFVWLSDATRSASMFQLNVCDRSLSVLCFVLVPIHAMCT